MKQLVIGIATPEEYQQYVEDVAAGKVKDLGINWWFTSFALFTMWAKGETTKTLYDQLQDIELEYITEATQEPNPPT